MSITASDLEKEIKEVEGVQVIIHQLGTAPTSYRAKWPSALSDDRTQKAFKRRLAEVMPGATWSISRSDGLKSIYPNVKMGVLRGKVAE
ncbi:hypothetical protein D3C86_1849060 [compost metagenome]